MITKRFLRKKVDDLNNFLGWDDEVVSSGKRHPGQIILEYGNGFYYLRMILKSGGQRDISGGLKAKQCYLYIDGIIYGMNLRKQSDEQASE